jgi:hypothetical protein
MLGPAVRRRDLERALPVSIGEKVWMGGGAILLRGAPDPHGAESSTTQHCGLH